MASVGTGLIGNDTFFRSPDVPLKSILQGRTKVGIIGAGMAGLTAALELKQHGWNIVLFEARSSPGGRVRTLREPFSDGLYAEAGATRIPDNHDLTLSYCRQFELRLVPFHRGGMSTVYHVRNKRIVAKRGASIDWPLSLNEDEKQLDLGALRESYLGTLLEEIKDASKDANWPPARLRK